MDPIRLIALITSSDIKRTIDVTPVVDHCDGMTGGSQSLREKVSVNKPPVVDRLLTFNAGLRSIAPRVTLGQRSCPIDCIALRGLMSSGIVA